MKHYLRFIPNLISLIRISLVIPTVLNLLAGKYIFALILFAIASVSDAIDGFLARFFKWQTDLGKILDPVADKLLMIGSITALWLNQIVPLDFNFKLQFLYKRNYLTKLYNYCIPFLKHEHTR